MKLFCNNCSNLTIKTTLNNKLIFQCLSCHSKFDTDDNDTLLFEETSDGDLLIYNKILNSAQKDPMNLKEYVKCPKCKYHIAKRIRIGQDMKLINICDNVKCHFQWLEM